MGIMYYVMSGLLIGIAFCLGALTEKHFADEEIKMLKTRKMRPVNIKVQRNYKVTEYSVSDLKDLDIDYPSTKKIR